MASNVSHSLIKTKKLLKNTLKIWPKFRERFSGINQSNLRYFYCLVCVDCELGPFGLREMEDKTVFLVAVERVKYI